MRPHIGRLACLAVACSLALPAIAEEAQRFLARERLPSGATLVLAEGDYEARSLGSFSLRLYAPADTPEDATTFFSDGLVHARDGSLEKLLLADLDGDAAPEVIVTARSAGTGNYLAAYAFAVSKDKLRALTAVEGLAADANPVPALRAALEGR
jgi:hypothetical protein